MAGYQNNYGAGDAAEYQTKPFADSANGRSGAMSAGAITHQNTQPQKTNGDAYQTFKNSAQGWAPRGPMPVQKVPPAPARRPLDPGWNGGPQDPAALASVLTGKPQQMASFSSAAPGAAGDPGVNPYGTQPGPGQSFLPPGVTLDAQGGMHYAQADPSAGYRAGMGGPRPDAAAGNTTAPGGAPQMFRYTDPQTGQTSMLSQDDYNMRMYGNANGPGGAPPPPSTSAGQLPQANANQPQASGGAGAPFGTPATDPGRRRAAGPPEPLPPGGVTQDQMNKITSTPGFQNVTPDMVTEYRNWVIQDNAGRFGVDLVDYLISKHPEALGPEAQALKGRNQGGTSTVDWAAPGIQRFGDNPSVGSPAEGLKNAANPVTPPTNAVGVPPPASTAPAATPPVIPTGAPQVTGGVLPSNVNPTAGPATPPVPHSVGVAPPVGSAPPGTGQPPDPNAGPAPVAPPGGAPSGAPAAPGYASPIDIASQAHNLFAPQNKQEIDDLTRTLRAQGALDGSINSGGFGTNMAKGVSSLIASQGKREGDFLQTDYENEQNRGVQRYQIDTQKFLGQLTDDTARLGIKTNDDLQRYLESKKDELAKYGIDTNDLMQRYQANLGAQGQKYSADAGLQAAALNTAASQAIAASNAANNQLSNAERQREFDATLSQQNQQFGASDNLNWANLQSGLYNNDSNRQLQWALLQQQFGMTPAQLSSILTAFGPNPPIFKTP